MQKIGIMGGTFDPIHYGHLVTAQEAFHQFNLSTVIFVPTGTPSIAKHQELLPREQRYIMTVIATAASDNFEVSRLEIDRPGPTHTIDTLRELRDIYGDRAKFYFITGADAVLEILAWKDVNKLGLLAKFIAATRPGYLLEEFKYVAEQFQERPKVHFMEVPSLAISSTDIRYRVKHKKPIRYLLPDGVYKYIVKKKFYR